MTLCDCAYNCCHCIVGMVNKDFELIVSNLRKLEFFPDSSNERVMAEALTNAVMNAMDNGEGSSLNFTKLSRNIQEASNQLPFKLPPFYTLIVRTLTILEGLALNVDPSFRLIRGAYPFIMKQILEDPSQEMIDLLKAVLLYPNGGIQWDKLEQFISIASSAESAINGNFKAMKKGQDRSDIIKAWTGTQVRGNVTLDVALNILDFLLSDSGQFLRDPLVNDIADILGETSHDYD